MCVCVCVCVSENKTYKNVWSSGMDLPSQAQGSWFKPWSCYALKCFFFV